MGIGVMELIICGLLLVFLAVAAVIIVLVKRGSSTGISPAPSIPAGWHPDPHGRHELRFWDGCQWTSNVSDAGVQSVDGV